jgi:hypothetical protein
MVVSLLGLTALLAHPGTSASAAPAGPSPEVPPFEAPEPLLEQAELDVKAMRAGRIAFLVGAAAPFVAHVGGLAWAPATAPGVDPEPETYAAFGLLTLGGVAMVAAPFWLDQRAQRSRKLLEQQGLRVRHVSFPVLTGLVAVAGTGFLAAGVVGQEGEVRGAPVAIGYAATAAALALGSRQVAANRRARVAAGWLEADR